MTCEEQEPGGMVKGFPDEENEAMAAEPVAGALFAFSPPVFSAPLLPSSSALCASREGDAVPDVGVSTPALLLLRGPSLDTGDLVSCTEKGEGPVSCEDQAAGGGAARMASSSWGGGLSSSGRGGAALVQDEACPQEVGWREAGASEGLCRNPDAAVQSFAASMAKGFDAVRSGLLADARLPNGAVTAGDQPAESGASRSAWFCQQPGHVRAFLHTEQMGTVEALASSQQDRITLQLMGGLDQCDLLRSHLAAFRDLMAGAREHGSQQVDVSVTGRETGSSPGGARADAQGAGPGRPGSNLFSEAACAGFVPDAGGDSELRWRALAVSVVDVFA